MKTTCTAFVLFLQILQCLALDDSQFILRNKDTGFCLVKLRDNCYNLRWTTGQRLLDAQAKCLGVQGKSVGSEVNFHECDENSDLQKWECKNGTVLALKDQQLYIELTADNTAVLSRTIGPNNHLTIEGTSSGACSRTHRELFTIGGNAAGMPCMFPFLYNNQWYSDCTTFDSLEQQLWCAVETKYQSERWGFCPVNSKEGWTKHPTTGAYYQFNTQSALTWSQADASCKQQGASLLSITDPHEYAYVTALLGNGGNKLWIGLILDPRQGWQWSNGKPYRYLKWDSGHPLPNPGHNCAIADPAVLYLWQSSLCTKRMGYICYSTTAAVQPTQAAETGFCSSPWIPYNGHCFHLNRTEKSWSDAQRWCHDERGDLVSIHNVEDQSFVISQLGYASADELWIGLNDITTEGLFDWSDHSTVSFTSWEFGKPAVSSDIKDCAVIRGENGNWADRVCAEKHGFICMKKSASKPTGDEVRQDEGCKTGWRRHGSYCYFIGTQTKSFDEAKDDCKSSDSYLADVSNAVDNAFLVSLVGLRPEKYFWLGLSNQENVDRFMWTNTNSVTFTHWNAEMPGHRQGCVAMTTGVFAGLWDVLLCTNKEKYICKHQAEGTASTPAPSSATPTSCSMGWNRIPLRNYCYKIFIQPSSRMKTWYEARDYCKAIGGDLLSIHSAEELDGLSTGYYSHSKVWIGLSAPDPVTGYVWSDGSPVQFQHWEDGEPNNKNNVESCTEFHMEKKGTSGSWNDVHCEMYHNWICQIRTGVTPKSSEDSVTPDYNKTSDGWIEWNGAQYYVIRSSMAMEEIRRFCQMKHGDLVTINSEAESVFLWKQVSRLYGSYWIGLNVELDKTYEWMDGSPVLLQRWDDNEPHFQRNDENCAFMTAYTGFWHVANCGAENSGICKRSGSPHANATVPPTVIPQGGCPENWKQLDSKCFNIVNKEKATWYAAREQCKSMGGNLASIVSKKEQVFLATQLMEAPDTNLWIGLHSTRDSSFLWTDGRRMRYTNWGFTSHTYHAYHPFMHHSFNDQDYYILPEIFQDKGCAVLNTAIASGIGKWIKKSCNDTNGYVCLRNVDPSFPVSAEPTTYLGYVKIFNDSIKFVSQKMNWDAAKKNCESDGGKLANLRNVWSKVYVEWLSVNTNDLIWIGLNKKETGGYYRYVDGWRLTETSWSRGEPRTNQPCVYVEVPGTWRTGDCSENFNSICMKSTDVPPTEPSGFPGYCPNDADTHHRSHRMSNSWLPFKGNCYLFVTDKIEWPDASANCMRNGGNLASIEDPAEQDFIKSNIAVYQDSQLSFWLGLYQTHRGDWHWLDKTPMDYVNWRDGQPDDAAYGLIKVIDGKWSTGNRWYDRAYICKTPKRLRNIQQTTSVSPVVDPKARGHIVLTIVLVIIAISIGAAIAIFLFKKSGRRFAIPEKLSTFDNPLFFNNERSSNLVDTNKLVANAEEENPGPVMDV